ncbi:MAG: ribosomal-processing cysteine protease Prp [Clostridiales bacterium]|nr:ribosomal-processing cysteine protease Prp [Clostridiales bacterium]
MVRVTFFQNREQQLTGFDCAGHADYAEENDVVCAAVSALVITCINSVEVLTGELFTCDTDEEHGMISFRLQDGSGSGAQLLLQSLALGLEEMEDNYEEYLDLTFEEVT